MGIANQPAEFAGSVPVKHVARPANPVAVFKARCEARAMLYAAGEFELIEAVDVLQASAVASGVLDLIGQDAVQGLMAAAFAPRDASPQLEPPTESPMPDAEYEGLGSTFASACEAADRKHAEEQQSINNRGEFQRDQHCGIPTSVQQTAEWLRFQANDPQRFEAWLNEHNKQERQEIIAYLRKKESRQ
jgi:hypothetical protein